MQHIIVQIDKAADTQASFAEAFKTVLSAIYPYEVIVTFVHGKVGLFQQSHNFKIIMPNGQEFYGLVRARNRTKGHVDSTFTWTDKRMMDNLSTLPEDMFPTFYLNVISDWGWNKQLRKPLRENPKYEFSDAKRILKAIKYKAIQPKKIYNPVDRQWFYAVPAETIRKLGAMLLETE